MTLSGTNNYTGGTTVTGGTLQGNTASLQGNITNNAAVIFNQAVLGSYGGVMSGSGSLTKNGAGTLILTAASTYAGATVLNAGSLGVTGNNVLSSSSAHTVNGGATLQLDGTVQTVGSLAGGGTVMNGASGTAATLTAGGNNGSTTFSGTLINGDTGALGLVKTGTGTLSLTGASSYSGGTTITGGMINFAAANNLGTGSVTLNGGSLQWATGNTTDISARLGALGAGGGSFDTNGNNVTLASAIGGAGGLTKQGTGTLILGGANNYSGGTMVSGGILQGTTTSLQGNIVNNANVAFNQATTGTYAGACRAPAACWWRARER